VDESDRRNYNAEEDRIIFASQKTKKERKEVVQRSQHGINTI